jgi:hypothetical protein
VNALDTFKSESGTSLNALESSRILRVCWLTWWLVVHQLLALSIAGTSFDSNTIKYGVIWEEQMALVD